MEAVDLERKSEGTTTVTFDIYTGRTSGISIVLLSVYVANQ